MRSSTWLACLASCAIATGCFLAHDRDAASETSEREPPDRTRMVDAGTTDPGHDICPSAPGPGEACPCGVAERLPHPDEAGRCFVCGDCPECEVPNPADGPLFWDATLSWQAPGGFAGTGPALIVRGDGTVRAWDSTPGFDPSATPDTPPDLELDIGFSRADQLFLRLRAADTSALPHDGGWAECYPILSFRECAACPEIRIEYNATSQIRPELDCVIEWFERLALPITPPAAYCD